MRISKFPLSTTKEIPAEATIASHRLMLKAGIIHKTASGLYTWMPLGLRTLRKVEQIVREEMNRAEAIELLMPAVQPAELWQESNRWEEYGLELLRIQDRHQRDFVFGPTHEEVITDIIRSKLSSYKQLPLNYYQIQTKFRDEIRPRFGIIRAREFLMKDAYSFHLNQKSLDETYAIMYRTYNTIFSRLQLDFRAVLADTGSIGGNESHEFHVLADTGEDAIAFSSASDYSSNVELAPIQPSTDKRLAPSQALAKLDTPGIKTIQALSESFAYTPQQCLKALFVKGQHHEIIALFLRGDHLLNVTKAQKHPLIKAPLEFAEEKDIVSTIGCKPGSLGPINLELPILVDYSAAMMTDFVCGANENDVHYINANWGRDTAEPETADLRNIEVGDPSPCGQGVVSIKRGIEVGHIFKLGEKYSELMAATVLDKAGKSQTLLMGCYGIGISRIVAATVEQNHDDNGIIWPASLAPFDVIITPVQYHRCDSVRQSSDTLYQTLQKNNIEVLFDDRDLRAGQMFADADLIGIPHRIVISERSLEKGEIEYKARTARDSCMIPLAQGNKFLLEKIGELEAL